MTKEDFQFLDNEFNKQFALIKAGIEKKYVALKNTQEAKLATNEKRIDYNIGMATRNYGTTAKDMKNIESALQRNKEKIVSFFEHEMTKEIEQAQKSLEKEMFKDWGDRLKAREMAYGPDDPEVKRLKDNERQEKASEEKRLQQATTFLAGNFNKEAANDNKNLKQQFRESADRSR